MIVDLADVSDRAALADVLGDMLPVSDADPLALFQQWVDDDAKGAFVALTDGAPAGLCVGTLAGADRLEAYEGPFGVTLDLPAPLGVFNLLVICPDLRRSGIGLALGQRLGQWLAERGVVSVVGVCWDNEGGATSRGLFERAGFDVAAISTTFYRDLHTTSGITCPHCAPKACSCRAVLFTRTLSSWPSSLPQEKVTAGLTGRSRSPS